jgi:UrcA family protein
MTKHKVALLGSAMMGAVLLCGVGIANAQDYGPYEGSRYYDNDYRPAALPEERVIVRPYYPPVQKRQLVGRINGEVNPTEFSLSREVAFSDLDLSRPLDRAELRARVHRTARDLCAELDARVPDLRGYPSEDRECVRQATLNAMRDVFYGRG